MIYIPYQILKIAAYFFIIFSVFTQNSHSSSIVAVVDSYPVTQNDVDEYIKFYKITRSININKSKALDLIIEKKLIFKAGYKFDNANLSEAVSKELNKISSNNNSIYNKVMKNNLYHLLTSQIRKNIIMSKIISSLVSQKFKITATDAQILEILESIDINTNTIKENLQILKTLKDNINKSKRLAPKEEEGYVNNNINIVDLGWVTKKEINIDLFNAISETSENNTTKIIETDSGYKFFYIKNKSEYSSISNENMNKAIKIIEKSMVSNLSNEFIEKIRRDTYIEIY